MVVLKLSVLQIKLFMAPALFKWLIMNHLKICTFSGTLSIIKHTQRNMLLNACPSAVGCQNRYKAKVTPISKDD